MKKNQAIKFLAVLTVICLFLLNSAFSETDTVYYPLLPDSQIKNVIFMIGDGMGLTQVASARIGALGAGGKLDMEKMPVTGLVRTHSANRLITCSAASGTALSTGYKTNNGLIAIDPAGNKLKTILEACKEREMSTGLVVTSPITNATPAAFAAHVKSRDDEITIASQLLENKVNVLLGGGRAFFIPQSERNSEREDDINLINKAKEIGYSYVQAKEELAAVKGNFILGLFQLNELTTKPPEPSLAEMTQKAIELLNRDSGGFFLMVEGSLIDWVCHDNNEEEAIRQTILFDEAVKSALEFALKDK
ncbi:MAG: alkaline phosphatase, partial [Bacteroidetes bacterium]|nr:alkaline phosphatase [Bacteroidota bacterium]